MTDVGPSGPALLGTLRQLAGMTQSELAQRADVSRSMVTQIEMAERRPSRKLLARLSEAMMLSEQDDDQLHVAFGFTPSGDTPTQVAAFLRADKQLTLEEADRLSDLIRRAYEQTLRQRDGRVGTPRPPEDDGLLGQQTT
jgi:transcriptional regulator with XRE-family HTH domain